MGGTSAASIGGDIQNGLEYNGVGELQLPTTLQGPEASFRSINRSSMGGRLDRTLAAVYLRSSGNEGVSLSFSGVQCRGQVTNRPNTGIEGVSSSPSR